MSVRGTHKIGSSRGKSARDPNTGYRVARIRAFAASPQPLYIDDSRVRARVYPSASRV